MNSEEIIYLEHDYDVNNSQDSECSQSLLNFKIRTPDSEILNLPVDLPCSSYSPSLLSDSVRRTKDDNVYGNTEKVTWLEPATKLLIALVQEIQPKVGKSLELKTKKKMWEYVRVKMENHGYMYTSVQIENKFKSLERSFKNKVQHNKKTGRDRVSCQYEKELNDMYKGRDKIFPQFILKASGSGTTQKQLEKQVGIEEMKQSDAENAVEEEKILNLPEPKRRKESSSTIRELILIKKEYNNKKLEAYERRTAQLNRKNELLEELIKTLNKKD